MRKPFVICIAAWVGGGKTTIVNELLKHLNNSKAIFFDSYKVDFLKQNYYQWSINGNDYNEWHFEPIAHDIENMLHEKIDYILLEFPMGRANDLISKYIDYAVFLDAPMDVLLARCIIRDFCNRSLEKKKLDNPLQSLAEYLTDYLSHLRITVINYNKTVKPSADFVVDSYQSLEQTTEIIIKQIEKVIRTT